MLTFQLAPEVVPPLLELALVSWVDVLLGVLLLTTNSASTGFLIPAISSNLLDYNIPTHVRVNIYGPQSIRESLQFIYLQ